ncbi:MULTISPECIES: hypothetical protein [Treponema]|uniref:hypothetical protein n=1 Tax=Treponema TaxID=157 RepID=UPI003FD8C01C
MNEEDKFLLKTLKKIYSQILDERTDMLRSDGENERIAVEYDDSIARLKRLLPEIHEVFDIYKLAEEDFVFIIETLEMYCESFIVDGRTKDSKERDEKEFEELQNFLDQFYDDEIDADEESDENFEGEE